MKTKQSEEQQEAQQGKRKKTTTTPQQSKTKQEQTIAHHAHKQQATKVLSKAATTKEEKRLAFLEQSVASLQETNVELKTTMGEMKENQHRDQVKIIGLQTELEAVNRKADISLTDIRKCKSAIMTMETKLASLSTAEEMNNRFDRIESMLSATFNATTTSRLTNKSTVTGKRKEQVLLLENGDHHENDEE
jgi:CII-binding regulator of phage lambda lysogenization HflD